MMDRLELHALADGELQGDEKQRACDRLRECEQSAAEYQAIVDLKRNVHEKCTPITCDETWAKCRRRIEEVEKTKRIEGFVGRYAWALCSLFVVLIFGAGIMNRSVGAGVRAGDVPAMMSSLSTLGSVAPREAQQWIRREGGEMPSIAVPKFRLISRAIGLYEGRKVMALRLQDDHGDFAVLLLPGARVIDGVQPVAGREELNCGQMAQSNCVTWQEGETAVIVTGPREIPELCEIADDLRQ